MTIFSCNGFRSVHKNQEYDYKVLETISDAAEVFAGRLARRYGRLHRAVVRQNSWTSNSSIYEVTIVAPSGTIEKQEWIRVEAM